MPILLQLSRLLAIDLMTPGPAKMVLFAVAATTNGEVLVHYHLFPVITILTEQLLSAACLKALR